ncbi:hypothetical protein ALT785_580009 [Alteromonas infernus]
MAKWRGVRLAHLLSNNLQQATSKYLNIPYNALNNYAANTQRRFKKARY